MVVSIYGYNNHIERHHIMVKWIWQQILDDGVCISHSTNTFRKGMNSIILLPPMGK